MLHNTVVGNVAPTSSAIADFRNGSMIGNIVVGPADRSLVSCEPEGIAATYFGFNDVYNGMASPSVGCEGVNGFEDNISADPLFVAPGASPPDYRLENQSPAIDAGDPSVAGLPSTDLAGAPRITDSNGDGRPVIDLGAHETATAVMGGRYVPAQP